LQFIEDEARLDQFALHEAGLGNVRDPAVDDHGGIEDHRPAALLLFGEFHVRNDEADVVLGLNDEADREIAADNAQDHLDGLDEHLGRLGRGGHDQVHNQRQPVGGHHPDQQAKKHTRQGRKRLGRQEDVRRDDQDSKQHEQRNDPGGGQPLGAGG
jgi:hypothetical protein